MKKQSISAIFGLTPASNFGIMSVAQQLEIWEENMKGYTEDESFMIKFPITSNQPGSMEAPGFRRSNTTGAQL